MLSIDKHVDITVNKHTILKVMLVLWLLIDSVSGYILVNFGVSIAQVVRAFFVCYIFILALVVLRKKQKIIVIAVMLTMVLLNIVHVIVIADYEIYKIVLLIKVLTPLLLYIVLYDAFIKGNIRYKFVKLAVYVNSAVMIFNLFLTFFNLGFSNYGTTTEGIMRGGTGFFYAGNEVAGTLLALHALNLLIIYESKFLTTIFLNLIFVIASIALFSKSASFGSALIVISFYYFRYGVLKTIAAFAPVAILLIISLYSLFASYLSLAASRWQYLYDETGAVFLFGGYKRWTAISKYIQSVTDQPVFMLSGYGWIGENENGFFDLTEAYGLIGIFIFIFWIIMAIRILSNKNNYEKGYQNGIKFNFLVLVLLLMISFFAGHIVQSSMLAPFLVFLYLFSMFWRKKCSC